MATESIIWIAGTLKVAAAVLAEVTFSGSRHSGNESHKIQSIADSP